MAGLPRVNVAWQQWPGAPGVSVFYLAESSDLAASVAAIRAMFNAVATLLPSGLTITVPGSGDIINDGTGAITGAWSSGTTPAVVTGSGAGAYAGNAGAVIHWLTTTVVNGRRLRGRTFLVPLISSAYDTSGSISTAALSTISAAAQGLVDAANSDHVVWHRPTGFAAGSSAIVSSIRVPDLAVSLRSRRI
jgi:hypothetical protein